MYAHPENGTYFDGSYPFGMQRVDDNNSRNSVETVYSADFMPPMDNFSRKSEQGSPKGFVHAFDRAYSAPVSLETLSSMSSLTLDDTNAAIFQAALAEQHSMGWGGSTLQHPNPQQFRYQNETPMFHRQEELNSSFNQMGTHQHHHYQQQSAPKHANYIDQHHNNTHNRHRNNHNANNRNNNQRNHRHNNHNNNHHHNNHHNNNNGNAHGAHKGQGYRRLWQQVASINQGGNLSGTKETTQSETTTVEDLLQLVRRLPPEASAVKAVSHGLYHLDSGALAALLKELNKAGHARRAQEIFDWLRTLPSSHDLYGLANTMTYTTMISQCGVQQALRRALELMAEMRVRGVQCNVHTYSALMNVCIKANELDLALDVYRQMIAEGCSPNLVTYNTLIDVYGKTGAWESAIAVLDALQTQGIEPEVRTYNTVIIACNQSSRAAEAVAVYERMLAAGAQPTATTYTALISAYGKAGQLDAALRIFQDMLRRGCERNVITYSSLISACEKAGRWELALELFQEMHREGCKPNVVTFNSLIAACAQGAQWERAKDLFDVMQSKGCKPDSVTFGALISAYDRAGRWQQALSAFEHMKNVNCRPDTVVYNTIIGCLWKTGLVWAQARATQIFHTACRHGHFRMTIHTSSSVSPSSSPSAAASTNDDCSVSLQGDGSLTPTTMSAFALGINSMSLTSNGNSAPNSPLQSPLLSSNLDRCNSVTSSDLLTTTTASVAATNTTTTSPAKTISTSSGGSIPGSPMFNNNSNNNSDNNTTLDNSTSIAPGQNGGSGGVYSTMNTTNTNTTNTAIPMFPSNSPFSFNNDDFPSCLNRSLSLPLPPKESIAICTFRSNSPAPQQLLSPSSSSFLLSPTASSLISQNSMPVPLSPVTTMSPTTPGGAVVTPTTPLLAGGTSVEFGMHAFTVGSAVLSLLRWISELKERLPKEESRIDPLQTVALVLNKGKPSREHTYPAIRDALLSMLSSWHVPMALTDIPQGCRIEATALNVAQWCTTPQAEQAMERFHGRNGTMTNESPRNISSEMFFREDSMVQARCAEAFAAVCRFETPPSMGGSSSSNNGGDAHGGDGDIHQQNSNGTTTNTSITTTTDTSSTHDHDDHRRRSDAFNTAVTFASACGFSDEVLHDGYLLMDRCMKGGNDSVDVLGGVSVNAVIMACLCIAAEQAGEINPSSSSLIIANAESITGLQSGDIINTQSTIKLLLHGNISSISALRVLKLYLERLGTDFRNSNTNTSTNGSSNNNTTMNNTTSNNTDAMWMTVAGTAMEILPLAVCDDVLRHRAPSLVAAAVLIAGRRAAGVSPFWPQSLAVLTNMMDSSADVGGDDDGVVVVNESALTVASKRAFELACRGVVV